MSDNTTRQDRTEALEAFHMLGPDSAQLVKKEATIDIQSMIGMSRTDSTLVPTVMMTIVSDGTPISLPLPPDLAKQIGTQLIEAAYAAETDVLTMEHDAEKGVPTRETIDRLHKISQKRQHNSTKEAST